LFLFGYNQTMHVNARAIIERKGSAGTEIVLQVRNKPVEGHTWIELPGGRVEEFESLLAALRREVREETGLEITEIHGEAHRLVAQTETTEVECIQPFVAYQTLSGPVDSMGVFFRCQVQGELLSRGDDAEGARWVPVIQAAAWLSKKPDDFSWIDRAVLRYYLQRVHGI
jgi:8-oxo-dGTP diphosphatase